MVRLIRFTESEVENFKEICRRIGGKTGSRLERFSSAKHGYGLSEVLYCSLDGEALVRITKPIEENRVVLKVSTGGESIDISDIIEKLNVTHMYTHKSKEDLKEDYLTININVPKKNLVEIDIDMPLKKIVAEKDVEGDVSLGFE